MTEKHQSSKTDTSLNGCQKLGIGCSAIFLLLFGLLAFTTIQSGQNLSERRRQLLQDLETLRDELPHPRKSHFGKIKHANALYDYQCLDWIVAAPNSWTSAPPNMSPPVFPRNHIQKQKWDVHLLTTNAYQHLEKGRELSPDEQKQLNSIMPILKHVEDGLRCDTMNWECRFEQGMALDVPNLIAARAVGNLLLYKGHTQNDPDQALEYALKCHAYGVDLSYHPTLIAAMIATAIESNALKTMITFLSRNPSLKACQRALNLLTNEPLPDLKTCFKTERVCMGATICQATGNPLDPSLKVEDNQLGFGGLAGNVMTNRIVMNREWEKYDAFLVELLNNMDLPLSQYDAKQTELLKRVEKSWTIISKVAVPNLISAKHQIVELEALLDITRLLLVAKIHEHKTGSIPKKIADFDYHFENKSHPKDATKDRNQDFQYKFKDQELTISTKRINGKDDIAGTIKAKAK